MGLIAVLSLGAFLPACTKGVHVEGKVVNAKTSRLLEGARVEVTYQRYDDSTGNWLDGGHASVTSDESGAFKTEHPNMRARFVILARKEGFYPNYDAYFLRASKNHSLGFTYNVTVQLAPVESPKRLPRGADGAVRCYAAGKRLGWSMAAKQLVPDGSADFYGELDESGKYIVALVARGQGGFKWVPGLAGEWALYNMPLAPSDRYDPRVDLRETREGQRPCYYVRTADGAHYGKIVVAGVTKARDYVGLTFEWVYQPDGSREMEILLEGE